MKNLLFLFILIFSLNSNSQTLINYDYMETWDWTGLWNTPANTGWYTNASVSSNQSAVLYGGGNGTSPIEANWYRMPNVTGLNPNKQYQFKFRLASYTFSNPTAATRGVDVGDYVSVQVSTNGGPYANELRITGNSNATWPYNTNGVITHTADGTFSTAAAPAGDVYQSGTGALTNGPSVIELNLPLGITQVAVDIYCRVNSAGEEWWIDNIELWDVTPIALPVEMLSYGGVNKGSYNRINWVTASEYNSDYFLLSHSIDGFNWEDVERVYSNGNTSTNSEYNLNDYKISNVTYYKITQFDFDGAQREYPVFSVIKNNNNVRELLKYVDVSGRDVSPNAKGLIINIYSDGSTEKTYN